MIIEYNLFQRNAIAKTRSDWMIMEPIAVLQSTAEEESNMKYEGIIDISIKEYHNCPGISRSAILEMKKSAYHYWHKYVNPMAIIDKEETQALIFGNAFHTFCLEPNFFNLRYQFMPKIDRRTKEGKEQYNKILASAEGKELLPEAIQAQISGMYKSLMSNDLAKDYIKNPSNLYEQSLFWRHEATGLLCKARPDIIQENILIDLKTATNAQEHCFKNDLYKHGYHIQAAMQCEAYTAITGKKVESFIFIVVEKDAPYATAIYFLDEDAIQIGLNEFNRLMGKVKKCRDTNIWPSYEPKIISLPNYVNYIDEEEL
tara:strand:- start:535 stop:1479 length:945 start_codon:yes stop_codon:yes gene_type:complete